MWFWKIMQKLEFFLHSVFEPKEKSMLTAHEASVPSPIPAFPKPNVALPNYFYGNAVRCAGHALSYKHDISVNAAKQ